MSKSKPPYQADSTWDKMQYAMLGLLANRLEKLLFKPMLAYALIKKAYERLISYDGIGDLTEDAKTVISNMLRMVKKQLTGEYEGLPKKDLLLTLLAITYFVSPLDVLPDFLPIIGVMDDIALFMWVLGNTFEEYNRFLAWEYELAHEDEHRAELFRLNNEGQFPRKAKKRE